MKHPQWWRRCRVQQANILEKLRFYRANNSKCHEPDLPRALDLNVLGLYVDPGSATNASACRRIVSWLLPPHRAPISQMSNFDRMRSNGPKASRQSQKGQIIGDREGTVVEQHVVVGA